MFLTDYGTSTLKLKTLFTFPCLANVNNRSSKLFKVKNPFLLATGLRMIRILTIHVCTD